jgi:hypothetical protein
MITRLDFLQVVQDSSMVAANQSRAINNWTDKLDGKLLTLDLNRTQIRTRVVRHFNHCLKIGIIKWYEPDGKYYEGRYVIADPRDIAMAKNK